MRLHQVDTIFALSSGKPPCGVSVIRVSGPLAGVVCDQIIGYRPKPRYSVLADFKDPQTGDLIDRGILIWFPAPNSFTGEDSVEFHCHGSPAVIDKFAEVLTHQLKCRLAEPGEFSNRAFTNEKLDLLEVEGLIDLIHSQTERQRRLSVQQAVGEISHHYQRWRKTLLEARALLEADLDFSDEEDVPGSVVSLALQNVTLLAEELKQAISKAQIGERLRNGVRIVITGAPNVGKSSLLNYLAQRDVAIVHERAGTTRDILDVHMDLAGVPVILSDTAGLRDSDNAIEMEGITRARKRLDDADCILELQAPGTVEAEKTDLAYQKKVIRVLNKADTLSDAKRTSIRTRYDHLISVRHEIGLHELLSDLKKITSNLTSASEDLVITRRRHLNAIRSGLGFVEEALEKNKPLEMVAEDLRLAADALGRVLGIIDVEDMFDYIFHEFCIGK